MKKLSYLFLLATILFIASCTDENASPGADDRDNFTGDWLCKETIAGSTLAFTITITKMGDSDTIKILNFSNYGSSALATGIVNGNSLTIPYQEIGAVNTIVQGTGVYSHPASGEKITMTYSTDGENATALCTRN